MLSNERILLERLTQKDAEAFYALYQPEDKTPQEFVEHIASLCNDIFTIRTIENPNGIIGDCALHHLDLAKSEIEIGGTLLPDYWGKGIMASAFELIIPLAREEYGVEKLIAKTEVSNLKALKFAEKLGFGKKGATADKVLLQMKLK